MAKLIMMKGLPGSGKSTKAKELSEQLGNAVRVNLDLLREMLHHSIWTGTKEGMTQEAELALVNRFLTKNMVVIVDDTNLGQSHLDKWRNCALTFGAKFEVVEMDTTVEECIRRDEHRTKQVGADVIMNMARKFKLYKFEKEEVIVDIDGTIADCRHRQHFLSDGKRDWKGFFDNMMDDTPFVDIVEQVRKELEYYNRNVILVTARPENYKKQTQLWLALHKIPYTTLIMRKAGDTRDDAVVKKEILDTYFDKEKIAYVIDDRPKVVRMWRESGLIVQDVGDGKEF